MKKNIQILINRIELWLWKVEKLTIFVPQLDRCFDRKIIHLHFESTNQQLWILFIWTPYDWGKSKFTVNPAWNEHMQNCTSIWCRYALHIIQYHVFVRGRCSFGVTRCYIENQEKCSSEYVSRSLMYTIRALSLSGWFVCKCVCACSRKLVGQTHTNTHTHTQHMNRDLRTDIDICCDMRTTSIASIFANIRFRFEKIARLNQIIMRFITSERFFRACGWKTFDLCMYGDGVWYIQSPCVRSGIFMYIFFVLSLHMKIDAIV